MFVSIDFENLRILHVHSDQHVVGGLVHLECTKVKHVSVENTVHQHFLANLTTLELNLLYRNTTGADLPKDINDLTRRECMADVIVRMSPRKVNMAELDAQLAIADQYLEQPTNESHTFKYVFGAKKPEVDAGGLFPLTGAPLSPVAIESAAKTAPARRYPAGRRIRPEVDPSAPVPEVSASAPATPRAPRAAGGARPTVFKVADEMWEKAGKPKEVPVLLELRKSIMTELETNHGIRRSTSSTALGDWQKQKLA